MMNFTEGGLIGQVRATVNRPITHQLMEEPGERVSCVEGYGSEVDGDSADVVW